MTEEEEAREKDWKRWRQDRKKGNERGGEAVGRERRMRKRRERREGGLEEAEEWG